MAQVNKSRRAAERRGGTATGTQPQQRAVPASASRHSDRARAAREPSAEFASSDELVAGGQAGGAGPRLVSPSVAKPASLAIDRALSASALAIVQLDPEMLRGATKEQKAALMKQLLKANASAVQYSPDDAEQTAEYRRTMTDLVLAARSPGELDYVLTRVDSNRLSREMGGPSRAEALEKIEQAHAPTPGDWNGYRTYLEEVTGLKSTGLSALDFLVDGTEVSPKGLEVLRSAKHSINLSVFELEADEVGNKVADLLCKKAKYEKVKVRVLLDEYGSKTDDGGAVDAMIKRLKEAGVEVIVNPTPVLAGHLDHRKVLVVDGQRAFTGGMNIGEKYQREWHDQQTYVEGPAVNALQRAFFDRWASEGGSLPSGAERDLYFRGGREVPGGAETFVVPHSGRKAEQADQNIKAAYLRAIRTAKDRFWLANPYFADRDIVKALCDAGRRGVDVRVVLPRNNDMPILDRTARGFYPELVQANVKVFEYQGPMAHQKVAIADDSWATVGSSNLDPRSLRFNDELNLVVLDKKFVKSIEQKMFEVDLKKSEQMTDPNPTLREILDREVLSSIL